MSEALEAWSMAMARPIRPATNQKASDTRRSFSQEAREGVVEPYTWAIPG
jgi:hypothetical protein